MTSPSTGISRAEHRPAVGGDGPGAAAPGRAQERRPRVGAERPDREQCGQPERAERADQRAHQQPAPAHPLRVFQRVLEALDILARARQGMAVLGERPSRHQPVRPEHETAAEREQADAQECAFRLRLATQRVDDRERERAQRREHEARRGDPRAESWREVVTSGSRSSAPRAPAVRGR